MSRMQFLVFKKVQFFLKKCKIFEKWGLQRLSFFVRLFLAVTLIAMKREVAAYGRHTGSQVFRGANVKLGN